MTVALMDAEMKAARDAMMKAVWRDTFSIVLTQFTPPPPLPWRKRVAQRLAWRWYDVRVWIAEKVLRLPQDSGDLY